MAEPSLDLQLSEIAPWTGASGDLRVAVNTPGHLDLERPLDVPAALGWSLLGLLAGCAVLISVLSFGIDALRARFPMGLAITGLVVGGLLAPWALAGLRAAMPTSLRIDSSAQRIYGVPSERATVAGLFVDRKSPARWVPFSEVEAVVLEVEQVTSSSGSGHYSVARLNLALRADGRVVALQGPRSAQLARLAWANARDSLLPLAVELARRTKKPLRVVYLGWPGGAPLVREL